MSTLVFSYYEQEKLDSQLWYFPVREMPVVALYEFLQLLHSAIDPEKGFKWHKLEVHLFALR